MLDGRELEVFLAIAQNRSFRIAAERLNIAQSVVSKRLKRLEDRVGAQLVIRGSRAEIRLTGVGELLLDEASLVVRSLARLEMVGQNVARGRMGPMRIGYVFSAAMNGTLLRSLQALQGGLPAIDIDIRLMETPEQIEAITTGEIDVGFVRPRPTYPADISAEFVHREAGLLAIGEGHPLASKRAVCLRQLEGEQFIIPQFHEEVGLIDVIRDIARAGHFAMPGIVKTQDFISASALAAAGLGIALVPASLRNLQGSNLKFVAVEDHTIHLDLVMISRRDTPAHALTLVRAALKGAGSVPANAQPA